MPQTNGNTSFWLLALHGPSDLSTHMMCMHACMQNFKSKWNPIICHSPCSCNITSRSHSHHVLLVRYPTSLNTSELPPQQPHMCVGASIPFQSPKKVGLLRGATHWKAGKKCNPAIKKSSQTTKVGRSLTHKRFDEFCPWQVWIF
jgi:hypothetical protein